MTASDSTPMERGPDVSRQGEGTTALLPCPRCGATVNRWRRCRLPDGSRCDGPWHQPSAEGVRTMEREWVAGVERVLGEWQRGEVPVDVVLSLIAEREAKAWDEGYRRGMHDEMWGDTVNPYRAALAPEVTP